ncbi:FAD-dependent oxidoreductase [Rhodobacteraceae bacterium B1Z28]|uniref:FAD-dependent oxidoreductase n=1 Tax=Ruegeria haliotis TaxID=2747601 RepID=A0ABX2PSI9_9RHOB|nr:FAD-dependent oxidoreductase [Ruegeria haliotis]NVO56626.1 FAD-dependent oxidoreductase [Ruegeria haliotis]
MKKQLPSHAQVVIIGGGIHGCSVAYHLAKQGLTDVVLLERKQLTSGTTWHAAGLVGQLQGSHATTDFAKYGIELLEEIEAETGQNPGYRRSGSISVAVNDERMAELKRKADFAKLFGIDAHYMSTPEIQERWPLMNPDGVLGGIYMPSDGSANPIDLTTALAKGARARGAKIFENIKVEEVLTEGGKVTGVRTDQGTITADYVVNCAGMWARELGQQNGVGVPLHACEHYYLVTEAIENLPSDLPVLRSYCDGTYWKEDAGKLLFGFAHFQAKPWAVNGIPDTFEFDSLPFVEDDVMSVLELAMERVPLPDVGIRTFFNGPESYSYDGRFTLGEAPDVKGYFVLAGVNSTGIQSGSGAGRALAQWIIDGHPPIDLSEMDPKRCEDFQARDLYLRERCPETLVLTYAMHWPNRQRETVRNLRRTPFYHPMKARGACFTETQGWERPGWFAPQGVEPKYEYSFGRQNWFDYAIEEQKAAREQVAMIDYTMLGKLMVEGRDAERFLQRICTNNMALKTGRVAYTLMLNERGGIESDVTVARHADDSFMMMSSISHTRRDYLHLRDQIQPGEDVRLRDATASYGVLGIMGPKSRDLLRAVSDDVDPPNEAFPFNSLRHFHIGHAKVFAQRLSYSGEMGWEIFVSPDFAEHVFEVLMQAGEQFGLRLIGGEALNALRLEKGFLHWGHDMAYTESPHQIGMEFVCKTKKDIPFTGRDAYLARKAENKGPFLCSVKLRDPGPLLHHNEPVLRDGKVAGYVTAGAWGQSVGAAVGLCLLNLPDGETEKAAVEQGAFTVLVEGQEIEADISLTPFYDPKSKRMLFGDT